MQVLKREDEGIPILEGAVRSFTRSVGGASVADIIVLCIYLLGRSSIPSNGGLEKLRKRKPFD